MLRRVLSAGALILASATLTTRAAAWPQTNLDDGRPVVGAIGDSLSAGFNAKHIGDNRELSWCTGESPLVNSHLQRLEAFFGKRFRGVNEAIAGSVAADLEHQTSRLLPNHPLYMTLNIGANDVCTWEPHGYEPKLAKFEDDVRAAVTRLVTAEPGVTITMAPIPNVYNLREVAHAVPGCQVKWDILGMCNPLLGSQRTQADREAFRVRWQQTNDALARVAASFPQQVKFNENAIDTPFTWDDVSPIDCFHPSILGQNLLAEKTWFYEQ